MSFQDMILDAVQAKDFEDFEGTEDRELLLNDDEGIRFGEVMVESEDYVLVRYQGRTAERYYRDRFELPERTEIYILPEGTNFLGR